MTLPTDDEAPVGDDRRGPVIVAVVVAAVAVVFVIGYASRPRTVPTTATQPLVVEEPEPVVTTTSPPPSSTIPGSDPTVVPPLTANLPDLADFPPAATRDLLTVVAGAEETSRLVSWPSDAPGSEREIPPGAGPVLFFDAGDSLLAFLGAPIRRVGLPLYVGDTRSWAPVAYRATSFAWHSTWPARLAWIETGRGLCVADFSSEGAVVDQADCIRGVTGRLTGFDDDGFILVDGEDVVRLTADGQEIERIPGEDALIGPDGRVIVAEPSGPGGYALVQADLTGRRHLGWTEGVGRGMIAWSPQATDELRPDDRHSFPELATLSEITPQRFRLQRRDLEGNVLTDIQVDGRFRDIRWDRSGRLLLAPGTAERDGVVLVYDLLEERPTFISFDDPVLESLLVIPAECEDASFVERDWSVRYDGPFESLWMAPSRDLHLGWTFLSARISDGSDVGEIATWVLPWYGGAPLPPPMSAPANEVAKGFGEGSPLDLEFFGIDDLMFVDGARVSQWCVATAGG